MHPPRPNPEVTAAIADAGLIYGDEDSSLVERFIAGDEASFATLYRKYYGKVHSVARGVLLDSEEAADVTQEIFTLVYRNIGRFDRRSRFGTWLYRIAVNRSIQESRKLSRKKNWVELHEGLALEAPEGHEGSYPDVMKAMACLKPGDRALLTLFYWEEMSIQEIADSLGCAMNAAKTRLYRARERFREVYVEERS